MKIKTEDIPIPKEIEKTSLEKLVEVIKSKQLKTVTINKPELNMYAIEELKDVVKSLCALGNGINEALKDDGKITFGDLPKFVGFAISLPASISGISQVPLELSELTEEEKTELITFAKEELNLGEHSEEVVVKILEIAYKIKDFVEFIK